MKMRIAIFHDYFGSIGGGEKLVLELAKALKADIITTEVNRKNLSRILPKNSRKNLRIINIGQVIQFPILKQIHSSIKFHNADFSKTGYDCYIMSGNWSIFSCRRHHPNIHYIHTPPRMFYDSKKFFYKIAPWYAKMPFLLWVQIHSWLLERQIKYVDKTVANSRNVQKRVKKYYRINSSIINPPIKSYSFRKYGDYWLSVTRFYPHKRLELQVEAFRRMPEETLVIAGGYMKGDHAQAYYDEIIQDIPKNVRLIGEVTEEELEKLYGECKAFISTARDEDFGMTVLEAMSAGKAVVATNEGGYRETVLDGKTGYLVKPDVDEIIQNIKKISKNPERYRKNCERQAEKYSVGGFTEKFGKIING